MAYGNVGWLIFNGAKRPHEGKIIVVAESVYVIWPSLNIYLFQLDFVF